MQSYEIAIPDLFVGKFTGYRVMGKEDSHPYFAVQVRRVVTNLCNQVYTIFMLIDV